MSRSGADLGNKTSAAGWLNGASAVRKAIEGESPDAAIVTVQDNESETNPHAKTDSHCAIVPTLVLEVVVVGEKVSGVRHRCLFLFAHLGFRGAWTEQTTKRPWPQASTTTMASLKTSCNCACYYDDKH